MLETDDDIVSIPYDDHVARGRMIFPWRPSKEVGIAALVTRSA
jgi:hypothetical protein